METISTPVSEKKFRDADAKRYTITMKDGTVREFGSLKEMMDARQEDNENR